MQKLHISNVPMVYKGFFFLFVYVFFPTIVKLGILQTYLTTSQLWILLKLGHSMKRRKLSPLLVCVLHWFVVHHSTGSPGRCWRKAPWTDNARLLYTDYPNTCFSMDSNNPTGKHDRSTDTLLTFWLNGLRGFHCHYNRLQLATSFSV